MAVAGDEAARFADALAAVASWPVPDAAVAIVGPDGVRAAVGPVDQVRRIASVTKPLVGHAVLVAVEDGSLGLDDPDERGTIRHLFSHCAGWDFDTETVLSEPGTKRQYSNTGWRKLGEALERATDLTVADYLTEAVFAPLGMERSVLRGHCGRDVHSTVDDLARFATELLRPRILATETLREATTVQFPGLSGVLPGIGRFPELDWGLGVQLHSSLSLIWAGTELSPRSFGHFGATGSFLWVDPSRDLAAVALCDRDFGPWALDVWPPFGDAVIAAHDGR
jgi:CubicO group peptidase (beta-lactamase class C family)